MTAALRVAFVTQDDPFYVRVFFEEFFRTFELHDEVKAVIIAPAMGKRGRFALARQMLEFYGVHDFLRVGFKFAFYKFASALPSKMRGRAFFSVKQVCDHYSVPVRHTENVNDPVFLEWLRQLDLDLIVSVAAPQVFGRHLIQLPRRGCVNIHNSKLPKYRGMLPNFWQMFHGEKAVGTTVHCINAGIDDGDILLQCETPIHSGESLDSLIGRTKRIGAGLVIEVLRRFRTNDVHTLPNRKEESTYYSFPTRKEVEEFRQRGYRLL